MSSERSVSKAKSWGAENKNGTLLTNSPGRGKDVWRVLIGDVDVRFGYYHPVRPANPSVGRRLKRDEMNIGDNALEIELVILENGVDIYGHDIRGIGLRKDGSLWVEP